MNLPTRVTRSLDWIFLLVEARFVFGNQPEARQPTPSWEDAAGLSEADQMSLLMAAPGLRGVVGAISATSGQWQARLLEHT
ncbi:hypothetical protein DVG80_09660 [Rhodococcus erythropolis]|nr:hypothetical protein DVG80_09660 [Rhodococcus erythropolis]